MIILLIQQSRVRGPSDKWPGAFFVLPYSANHISRKAKSFSKKRLGEDVAAAQLLFTPRLPMAWHMLAPGEGGGCPMLGPRGGFWHNFCNISGETVEFPGVSLVVGELVSPPSLISGCDPVCGALSD